MKLTLGYSFCPNDTFIFDALVHHKIDTEGIEFEVIMADVQELNSLAFRQFCDITKLSYAAYLQVTNPYILLNSGSALGNNCGPILIAKPETLQKNIPVEEMKIALPGKNTTANFLFNLAYPNAKNQTQMLFSDIITGVLQNKFDVGVIIHEQRFVYESLGLAKVIDLGEYWENTFQVPIPLGGIAAKRSLGHDLIEKIDRLIKTSVEYAFQYPESSKNYVMQHAQEMSEEVCKMHIDLYVNQYSITLGEKGIKAVDTLMQKSIALGLVDHLNMPIIAKSYE
jgi:1,4-dihydroxy-6-naphthoate synthase